MWHSEAHGIALALSLAVFCVSINITNAEEASQEKKTSARTQTFTCETAIAYPRGVARPVPSFANAVKEQIADRFGLTNTTEISSRYDTTTETQGFVTHHERFQAPTTGVVHALSIVITGRYEGISAEYRVFGKQETGMKFEASIIASRGDKTVKWRSGSAQNRHPAV
jgi:hypothetical protein